MKFRYYILSMALMATATVGLTSCHDDDNYEDIFVVKPDQSDLVFTSDNIEVKIGAENKVELPVEESVGSLRAFSLNPEVATIVNVDGVPMIEGLKNGVADIMVSDGDNNYKGLHVTVYTTDDKLELSATDLSFELPYGLVSSYNEVYVLLGNGGYTIVSDNEAVEAAIDSESGVITITGSATDEPVKATLTVTDCRNLSASLDVTFIGGMFAYTEADLAELSLISKNTGVKDGRTPYYLSDPETFFTQTIADGKVTFGGKYENWGWVFAVAQITYPEGTQVGEEVEGVFTYGEFASDDFPGKVKIIVDNDVKRIAVWYNIDLTAKKLSRGYVVWMK